MQGETQKNEQGTYQIVLASERLPIKDVVDYFDYIDELRSKIMKRGIDYDTIPGTNKPTLLKPGAEKLCFAFKLSPTYEVLESIEEHEKIYHYQKFNKKSRQNEEVEGRGFFFYKIICRLVSRDTGVFIAEQVATCSTYDPGKGGAPANTVAKLACKRAYVGATLAATFTSDRFTQDMEDYAEGGATEESNYPATDKQMGFISKLLKSNSVPDDIRAEVDKWAAGEFQAKSKASEYIERLTAITKKNGNSKAEPGDKPADSDSLISEVWDEEKRVIALGEFTEDEILKERAKYAGNADPSKCTPAGLKNYIENLKAIK